MTLCIFFSIGLAVHETNLGAMEEDAKPWFHFCMNFLTGIYALEILVRLYVSGPQFFLTILNMFDFLLVVTDLFMVCLERVTGGAPNLFALRLVRLVRTLRIIRILTFVRPLYLILHGFISAMQAIFWATTLLVLSIMLWSILAVNFLHPVNLELVEAGLHPDCYRCQRAFESVSRACLTFAETTIAGETFGDISIPIIEQQPLSLLLFLGVHITIQLGIMNLILAVIVDQAQAARHEDAEQALADKEATMVRAKDTLFKLCVQMDTDFSGSLTLDELLQGVDTLPEFMNQMRLMDISREDMEVVFSILDIDKSGDVNYREFVEELYKLKNRDSHTLLIFIKHYVMELRESVARQVNLLKDYVETDNFHIHEDLTSIYNFLNQNHGKSCDDKGGGTRPSAPLRLTYHSNRVTAPDRTSCGTGTDSVSSLSLSASENREQGFAPVRSLGFANSPSLIIDTSASSSMQLAKSTSGIFSRAVGEVHASQHRPDLSENRRTESSDNQTLSASPPNNGESVHRRSSRESIRNSTSLQDCSDTRLGLEDEVQSRTSFSAETGQRHSTPWQRLEPLKESDEQAAECASARISYEARSHIAEQQQRLSGQVADLQIAAASLVSEMDRRIENVAARTSTNSVAEISEDDEAKVTGGLSDGGEPQAGPMVSPCDMTLGGLALWDAPVWVETSGSRTTPL